MIIRRKIVWLMILMVWIGMVTSIIVYQGNDYLDIKPVTSSDVNSENNKSSGSQADNTQSTQGVQIVNPGTVEQNNVNYTKAKEEATDNKDFFIEYRLERDKSRSEQINIYREMINNPNTDEASKKEAQQKMMALTDKMEKEMEIESLIRARGYKDALAYIHDEAVDVIIHTNGLEKADVAKIGDIVVKVTSFNTEDVTIIEKKINT